MPIAYWCVLAAGLLPLITIGAAKWSRIREFDNAAPRRPGFYAEGVMERAWGAQQNGFEAFPLFAAAVLTADRLAAAPGLLDVLAVAFLGVRLAYTACYLAGAASLRSAVWMLGLAISLAIFTMPVWAG